MGAITAARLAASLSRDMQAETRRKGRRFKGAMQRFFSLDNRAHDAARSSRRPPGCLGLEGKGLGPPPLPEEGS
jgi:hypothetical protein